jgi:hypothetical protein
MAVSAMGIFFIAGAFMSGPKRWRLPPTKTGKMLGKWGFIWDFCGLYGIYMGFICDLYGIYMGFIWVNGA